MNSLAKSLRQIVILSPNAKREKSQQFFRDRCEEKRQKHDNGGQDDQHGPKSKREGGGRF